MAIEIPDLEPCPVCEGEGTVSDFVPNDFDETGYEMDEVPATCETCKGKGEVLTDSPTLGGEL